MNRTALARIATHIMAKVRPQSTSVHGDVIDIPELPHSPASRPVNSARKEAIAKRAYELWLERGCPEGSAELDWYRAEAELSHRGERTSAGAAEAA